MMRKNQLVYAAYGGKDVTQHIIAGGGDLYTPPGGYNTRFGDTLPGIKKTLVFVVMDPDKQPPRCVCSYFEESDECRFDDDCDTPQGRAANRQMYPGITQIVSANYGGKDVTPQIQGMFNTQGQINIPAGGYNGTFGDPKPGQVKSMVVNYIATGIQSVAYWFENEHCQLRRG